MTDEELGFDDAIAKLESWFVDLPLRENTQTTDATTFARGAATVELLDAIDAESMLDRLIERYTFKPGVQLKLVRDRENVDAVEAMAARPGGRSLVDAARLVEFLDNGFTAVFDGIDVRDRFSNHLARMFEISFGCPVNINAYLSSKPVPSFGSHWDDQEVVIVQLIGSKDWSVEEPVDLSMHKDVHGSATSSSPIWAGTLHPGDAIYVPRGWGHYVTAGSGLSFHYTITIPRLNGLGLVDGLVASTGSGIIPALGTEIAQVSEIVDRLQRDRDLDIVRPSWASSRVSETLRRRFEP